jgi:beta-aspartyl-dipeptidase (metallo-type)
VFKLLKNAHCFTPQDIGIKDILVIFHKICLIEDDICSTDIKNFFRKQKGEVIDCSGLIAVPGFIDQHVHIVGGGGEHGPLSRTPEINLSDITMAGVTTVVGVLGFDSVTRSISGLLAKARALENEGISTCIYTGSYGIPPATLTGKVLTDIALIDKVVGVGEIAISDHRSSHPSLATLREIAVEARTGGMLGGKAGIVHIHVGDGKEGLNPVFQLLEESDFPVEMFVPTHINRNPELFGQGIRFLRAGGNIDLTAGEKKGLSVPHALERIRSEGFSLDHVTITSDGNGSIGGETKTETNGQSNNQNYSQVNTGSKHREPGKPGIQKMEDLLKDFRKAALEQKIPLTDLLKTITTNPARILKMFPKKGTLAPGSDADILILRPHDLKVEMLLSQGDILIKEEKPVKKGTYEN